MHESGTWRVRPGETLTFGRGKDCTIRLAAGDRGTDVMAGLLAVVQLGIKPQIGAEMQIAAQLIALLVELVGVGPDSGRENRRPASPGALASYLSSHATCSRPPTSWPMFGPQFFT